MVSERPKTIEESLNAHVIFPAVARLLEDEDPAKNIALMLGNADHCVAAHKRLIATYGTALPDMTDRLSDGVSGVAMVYQLIADEWCENTLVLPLALLVHRVSLSVPAIPSAFLSLSSQFMHCPR